MPVLRFPGIDFRRNWGGASAAPIRKSFFIFFAFLHYIHHTRPDPITKRISAVPPYKWRDVSYICLTSEVRSAYSDGACIFIGPARAPKVQNKLEL